MNYRRKNRDRGWSTRYSESRTTRLSLGSLRTCGGRKNPLLKEKDLVLCTHSKTRTLVWAMSSHSIRQRSRCFPLISFSIFPELKSGCLEIKRRSTQRKRNSRTTERHSVFIRNTNLRRRLQKSYWRKLFQSFDRNRPFCT